MSVTPLRPVHLDHLRMPSSDSAMGVGFRCVTPVRMNAVSGYPRATRSDSAFERVKHTLFFELAKRACTVFRGDRLAMSANAMTVARESSVSALRI